MKLCVMSYAMQVGGWDFTIKGITDLCQFTRDQDIDGIDWCSLYGNDPKEVRKIMDDHGLNTACYTDGADLNYPDHNDRLPGLDTVRKSLETAAILGVDKIMIPIGGRAGLTAQQSRNNNIKGLIEAVDIAKSYGITVTIEHMHGLHSPFVTSSDINETLAAVPGLKVTFDSGNCLTGGEPSAEGFLKSKDSIIHAHYKDWVVSSDNTGVDGSDGRFYTPVLIGEGIVDHESVIRAMVQSNYQGYIDIEYQAPVYNPRYAVKTAKEYIYNLKAKIEAE